MSTPTREDIDHEVAQCRAMERKFPVSRPDHTAVVVALAEQRDELVALLERWHPEHPGDRLNLFDETIALLASIKGTP